MKMYYTGYILVKIKNIKAPKKDIYQKWYS